MHKKELCEVREMTGKEERNGRMKKGKEETKEGRKKGWWERVSVHKDFLVFVMGW